KVLIVFTEGDDNASLLTASGAVAHAQKLGIPLYAIAEGEATHSSELSKVLNELSERTGGIAYQVKKADDIERVFGIIATNLKHLYLLSYKPNGNRENAKWRKIDIVVSGLQNYRLRAKQGYFPD